jgi:hypothetical protein
MSNHSMFQTPELRTAINQRQCAQTNFASNSPIWFHNILGLKSNLDNVCLTSSAISKPPLTSSLPDRLWMMTFMTKAIVSYSCSVLEVLKTQKPHIQLGTGNPDHRLRESASAGSVGQSVRGRFLVGRFNKTIVVLLRCLVVTYHSYFYFYARDTVRAFRPLTPLTPGSSN